MTGVRCNVRRWLLLAWVGVGLLLGVARAEVAVRVDGLGWLKDREMRLALERLMNTEQVDVLTANAIEDGAVILNSALNEEGFQQPTIDIVVPGPDGPRQFRFDPTFAEPLPRDLTASEVKFAVDRGVRWRIANVEVEGLTLFDQEEGEAYFRTDATLLKVARTNAYSKSQLNRSEGALLDELRRRGYAESSVTAAVSSVDEQTGAVTVRVLVREGPRWQLDYAEINGADVEGVELPDPEVWIGRDWTPALEQEIRETVRLALYRAGYPDVGLHLGVEVDEPEEGVRYMAAIVTVVPGARVQMAEPRFVGNEITRESVLRHRVRVQPGEPLNRLALENARYRISRLGVFEYVDLTYEPSEGPLRTPVFTVREAPRSETSLLFGYGSYEQFRGGVEYRQRNIFGLAHQSRLTAIQSVKSTRGEYTYTIPDLFGETVDGSARLFALQREEIAFLRQEFGTTLSLRRPVARIRGDVMVAYTFEALRTRRNALSTEVAGDTQLNVASFTFGATSDRRDNPLRPRRGYHVSTQLEVASPTFGGVAQYQRLEIAGAYHTSWGRGRWIHAGLSHGLITTAGAANDRELPVNKRFYPGGDNSIRGYQYGEAAPRGADGRFIGAKTFTLLNLEVEQALTRSWAVVAFADLLGQAAQFREYPFSERLYSVGLGIRYQTIVGPIRLEYGRNINRRPHDPSGTWHISIGYPF